MTRLTTLLAHGNEARRVLRAAIVRSLGQGRPDVECCQNPPTMSDEAALGLLQGVEFDHADSVEHLLQSMPSPDASAMAVEPGPILPGSWGRVVWGRISIPFELARTAAVPEAPITAPPATFLNSRYGTTVTRFLGPEWVRSAPGMFDLNPGVGVQVDAVGCASPGWVAARLWERRSAGPEEPAARLKWWHERWRPLGYPRVTPFDIWAEDDAAIFMEACLGTLGSGHLLKWEEFRSWCGGSVAAASGHSDGFVQTPVASVPKDLIARWLWLDDRRLERPLHWTLEASAPMLSLVEPLVAQIVATGFGPGPNPFAFRLITLAVERPELLWTLIGAACRHPALVAEFALDARTAPLACLIAAGWQTRSDPWDRVESSFQATRGKMEALTDLLEVMGVFRSRGEVDPVEVASLLLWLRRAARHHVPGNRSETGEALASMERELAKWSPEDVLAVAASLQATMPTADGDMTQLAAMLNLVDSHDLIGRIDPDPIVMTYLAALRAARFAGTGGMRPGAAARLYELATRCGENVKAAFLTAVEPCVRRLSSAVEGENAYSLSDDVAGSVRLHLRVLSRAVTGSETPAAELTRALVSTMQVAALPGGGTVALGALSPRHEVHRMTTDPDGALAGDVGQALGTLEPRHGSRVLAAALLADEPYFLAKLKLSVPGRMRPSIDLRLTELPPAGAAGVRSLTETQARIEALQAAGRADLADAYIDDERGLRTLGHVPGRGLFRLRVRLNSLFMQKNWDDIALCQVPEDVDADERRQATDAIDFFMAAAALRKGGEDVARAEAILSRLHGTYPGEPLYATNLFAASVSRILGEHAFGPLSAASTVEARRLLANSSKPEQTYFGRAAGAGMATNLALLSIALGDVRGARKLLAPLRTMPPDANVEALTAAALAKEGRRDEALLVLAEAETQLGRVDVLDSVKGYVITGRFASGAHAALTGDPMAYAELAASKIRFTNLDAASQANILHLGPDPLLRLMVESVRAAGSRTTSLIPSLRKLGADTKEDDVTAVFGRILEAGVSHLGWHVAEQSRGGLTAAGGPGERDLVITKDGSVVAVVEAVACRLPLTHGWMRDDLAAHLVKVLAYANCRIFLHVTYAFSSSPATILDHLAYTAATCVPPQYRFVARDEVPTGDSAPPGAVMRFVADAREIALICLVFDMRLEAEHAAARAGAALNPRRGRKKNRA